MKCMNYYYIVALISFFCVTLSGEADCFAKTSAGDGICITALEYEPADDMFQLGRAYEKSKEYSKAAAYYG